jgi:hypothetical protein
MHTQPDPDIATPEDEPLADARRRRREAADALAETLLVMFVLEQRSRRGSMSRANEIGGENA